MVLHRESRCGRAYLLCNLTKFYLPESAPSNFAYLVGQGGQTTLVRFVSQQPANEMIVGESKTYSPVVQISTNAGNTWLFVDNVTFALQAIQGMNWENIAIDAKTGTTTWTARQSRHLRRNDSGYVQRAERFCIAIVVFHRQKMRERP